MVHACKLGFREMYKKNEKLCSLAEANLQPKNSPIKRQGAVNYGLKLQGLQAEKSE